jgi:hypothetical protein
MDHPKGPLHGRQDHWASLITEVTTGPGQELEREMFQVTTQSDR